MRKCTVCGNIVEQGANFCTACGASGIVEVEEPTYVSPVVPTVDNGHGNIPMGILGAVLFALLGGVVYFLLYQMDIIAGISGLIIYTLAAFGYGLFARSKNKTSLVRLIAAIVLTIVVIYLAEYLSVAYAVYDELDTFGVSFSEVVEAMPELLEEPDVSEAVAEDLAFAYIFAFITCIGTVVATVKARNTQKKFQQEQ